ncbi:response regulator [Sphingomonas sp. UYP23]
MKPPIVLVVDGDARNRRFVDAVLSSAQWHVLEARDDVAALAQARVHRPVLILIGDGLQRGDATALVAALRAEPPPLRSTAILAQSDAAIPDERLWRLGFDGCVAPSERSEALLAAVADWRPDDELAGAHRLAEQFGQPAIVPLIARFREELTAAVASLNGTPSQDAMHRVAGIAGTLGFDRVGSSWERLSRGDAAILSVARREGRRVLAQIDRDPIFAPVG